MIKDMLLYIIKSMKSRFTRSFLTILSVLIGIMAIYALMSFGQGLTKYVDDTFKTMGTDKLILMPKGAGAPGTTGTYIEENDYEFVKKINGVEEATAVFIKQTEVKIDEKTKGKWVFVMGSSMEFSEKKLIDELSTLKIAKGRDLKKGEKNKIVVGYSYMQPNIVFKKALKTGDTLLVKGHPFEIVGFYDDVGNPQDNSQVYMTLEDAKEVFDTGTQYDMVFIRANSDVAPSDLAIRIEEKLMKKNSQKEGQETFYVQTFEQMLETYGTIITVLNSILLIIALISVIVAAVNIMNTMYTAVLERTREIGIMKAIGARNNFILWVFFLESGFLGLIGGVIGVLLGFGLASLGGAIAAGAGYSLLKPFFPWWLTIGCLIFSFAVGAAAGFFPARAASKHKPVDALRYE